MTYPDDGFYSEWAKRQIRREKLIDELIGYAIWITIIGSVILALHLT